MIDLTAIKARVDAATPGPWVDVTDLERKYYGSTISSPQGGAITIWRFGDGVTPSTAELQRCDDPADLMCDSHYQTANDAADVAFIAHARADIPALLQEIERLTAERDEANKGLRGAILHYRSWLFNLANDKNPIVAQHAQRALDYGDAQWPIR